VEIEVPLHAHRFGGHGALGLDAGIGVTRPETVALRSPTAVVAIAACVIAWLRTIVLTLLAPATGLATTAGLATTGRLRAIAITVATTATTVAAPPPTTLPVGATLTGSAGSTVAIVVAIVVAVVIAVGISASRGGLTGLDEFDLPVSKRLAVLAEHDLLDRSRRWSGCGVARWLGSTCRPRPGRRGGSGDVRCARLGCR